MPTTHYDPPPDADIVAATLRAQGYAARSYSAPGHDGDPTEFGVAIHIVCTEAWRYPDGRWEFIDRPARLHATARTAPHSWLYNRAIPVPDPTSAAALAAWVVAQLPPPDLPEYRVYWQFSPPDTPPATAPPHWAQRWREHWTRGGANVERPTAHVEHRAAP